MSIATLECVVFTISPIRVSEKSILSSKFHSFYFNCFLLVPHKQVVNETLEFSAIGLIDMYNSGGAIEGLSFANEPAECTIRVEARGCGRFGAYSSKKPIYCTVDDEREELVYDSDNGLVIVELEGECKNREIRICY